MHVFEDQAAAEIAITGVAQRQARLPAVDIVQRARGDGVLRKAVVISELGRGAQGQLVVDRRIEVPGQQTRVQVAGLGANRCAARKLGFCGDDADGAAHHVLAEQHALRTAENFHTLQVVEVHVHQTHTPDHDLIEEDAHGTRRAGRVEARIHHAANVQLHIEGRDAGERNAARLLGEIAGVEYLRLFQRLAGKRRNRQR